MKRKIEITFELEETVFYQIRNLRTGFCRPCGRTVEVLSVEEAAVFLSFSRLQILRLLETGEAHLVEAERDGLCRRSIENLQIDDRL